ncbi:MAG: UbiA family prenyltransferase [Pseudomonadota bacterium]
MSEDVYMEDRPETPRPGPRPAGAPALAVDLVGALVRVDVLHESAFALASRDGIGAGSQLLSILARRRLDRASVKADLAERILPDPRRLPYRQEVLERLRAARAEGRRTVLATGSDARVAQAVADHLGLFDEVHGSTPERNLDGAAKAELLAERFGVGGFDYIGDSRADRPVWARARRALTAGARSGLARALDAEARASGRPTPEHMETRPAGLSALRPLLRAMRPHQWAKNALVLVPMLSVHSLTWASASASFGAFAAFCLAASAAYMINDLLDLEADRAHPRKRFRPFASGEAPALTGAVAAAGLLAGGLGIAAAVNPLTFGIAAFYFGATVLYSLVLKRELIIDICTLAGLYTLRLLGGAAALNLYLSPWMLALSVFLFLSLGAMKRQTELVDAASRGIEPAGRAYRPEDLPVVTMMAIASGYVSVLVLALYIYSPVVQQLYESPLILWGAPPILLYWLSRMAMLSHRGLMDDDPVFFALRDPMSWFCGSAILLVATAAAWI